MEGDEQQVVSFDGQPAPESQEQAQPQGAAQSYITMTDAEKIIEQVVEKALRRVQSLTDRTESRLKSEIESRQKAIDQALNELRSAGMTIPESAERGAKERVVQEALLQASGKQETAVPNAPSPEIVNYVNARADQMFREAGVTVEENDPEASGIDFTSPESFLTTLKAAVQMKSERMKGTGQVQPPAQEQAQVNPAARMPSLTGGGMRANPMDQITDPTELIRMGLRKLGPP